MSLFEVDKNLCTMCGFCAEDCPMSIISWKKKEMPRPVTGADAMCIKCGHCVAVCPHAALVHSDLKPEDCAAVSETPADYENVSALFASRRSIRRYRSDAVDRDALNEIINSAAYAPTGHNTRLVRWIVVYDTEELKRMSGMVADWMEYMVKNQPDMAKALHFEMIINEWKQGRDRICRGAPHLVMACAPKGNPMSQASCTIALSHLELLAHAKKLGACWAGYFDIAARFWPPLAEALKLPAGHSSFGALMIGYPKFSYKRIPQRSAGEILYI